MQINDSNGWGKGNKRPLENEIKPSTNQNNQYKRRKPFTEGLQEEEEGFPSSDDSNSVADRVAGFIIPDSLALEAFDQSFEAIGSNFKDRIKVIKKCFSKVDDKYVLWLELDEGKRVFVVFRKGHYESESLGEKEFLEPAYSKNKFYYLEVFEDNNEPTSASCDLDKILCVRASALGSTSELVKIAKGKQLTGNQIFDVLYSRIESVFNTRRVLLYDDAQFPIESPKTHEEVGCFPLRELRALASDNDEGLSWYEEKGFEALKCTDFATVWPEVKVSQNPQEYRTAIKVIRETSLDDLHRMLNAYPKSKVILQELRKEYVASLSNPTIHDLVKSISQQMRTEEKLKALKDFELFYNHTISPWTPKVLTKDKLFFATKSTKAFFKALETLNAICIFQKKLS